MKYIIIIIIFVRGGGGGRQSEVDHSTILFSLARDHTQVTIQPGDTTFFYTYHVINHKGN